MTDVPANGSSSRSSSTYQVNSIDRAVRILGCFTLNKLELSLSEICKMTGLPKPTVFRLLSVLEQARLIERTPDQMKYQVGIRAFELGGLFIAHLSVERVAHPFMEKLTEKLHMTCNLAILDDGQAVYIATTDVPSPMRYAPIVGYRHYIHCSALGKALILQLTDSEILNILKKRGMCALTPYTITDSRLLLNNLATARSLGYTVDDQEGGVGVRCFGVPIYNHLDKITAAISVSGLIPLLNDDNSPQIINALKETAREISQHLGWKG